MFQTYSYSKQTSRALFLFCILNYFKRFIMSYVRSSVASGFLWGTMSNYFTDTCAYFELHENDEVQ